MRPMGRIQVLMVSTTGMPHTLSDADTSLLLRHLLRHPADPALVPIIHSLHSSLVTSRTYSPTNSGELFPDFLGSVESPEDFNDWDTPSLLDPSLSDLLDDRYSVDDANFERQSGAVVPLSEIRQSCMLIPKYKDARAEGDWTSANVLDKCSSFVINNWQHMYAYQTIW